MQLTSNQADLLATMPMDTDEQRRCRALAYSAMLYRNQFDSIRRKYGLLAYEARVDFVRAVDRAVAG